MLYVQGMDVDDSRAWEFDKPLQSDADMVECPECATLSPLSAWREGEVYCELCGDHAAMICPACDEFFDHVYGPTFKVELAT